MPSTLLAGLARAADEGIVEGLGPDALPGVLASLAFVLILAGIAGAVAWLAGGFRPIPLATPPRSRPDGRVVGSRGHLALVGALLAGFWVLFATLTAAAASGLDLEANAIAAVAVSGVASLAGVAAALGVVRVLGRDHVRLGLAPELGAGGVLRGVAWSGFALPLAYAVTIGTVTIRLALGQSVDEAHPLIEQLVNTRGPWLAGLIAFQAVIVAPLSEEVVFRGILQTGAASVAGRLLGGRAGAWFAIGLVSVAFTVIHPLFSWPTIFVLSLVLGWLYERTGNLWVPIVVHAVFNGVATGLALLSALA